MATRLRNVDAPEKGQPGAAKPTEALRKLIQGEEVIINIVARDPYSSSVANVGVQDHVYDAEPDLGLGPSPAGSNTVTFGELSKACHCHTEPHNTQRVSRHG
jgi:hypothetical protein